MKRYASIMLLFTAICTASPLKSKSNNSQLFLVGGGLKTCTSINKNNCNSKALAKIKQLKNAKQGNLYQVSQETINLVKKHWLADISNVIKNDVNEVLQRAAKQQPPLTLSKTQLTELLEKYDKKQRIRQLNDLQYYTLLDLLEQPVIDVETGKRKVEYVDLINSLNVFSTDIYQQFVTQAKKSSGKDKPNVIVLTASARDPFEAADFYQTVFEQAGANALWLPLDATINALMQMPGDRHVVCQKIAEKRVEIQGSLNRELIYPDLTAKQFNACLFPQTMIDAINTSDALFINGGDQSLTLKAFVNHDGSDNVFLKQIKNKLKKESFIVGGTSAGTAVMSGGHFASTPVVMITNGQSDTAIVRGTKKDALPNEGCNKSNNCHQNLLNDDLTYNSNGGLGLFPWGILDTHFSERGRQGRLAVLSQATNSRFAFGVDEATALIVSDLSNKYPKFNVIGQGGVFIVDNYQSLSKISNTVKFHYITNGDFAKITDEDLEMEFAKWKNIPAETQSIPKNISNIFEAERFQQATELLCRTNEKNVNANDRWENNNIHISIEKLSDARSAYGAIKFKDKVEDYCSFKNYSFSFSVQN